MHSRRRVAILGAAGRDFHTFNVLFRSDPSWRVMAFTAAQIPDIAGRRYPAALAGPDYPDGIPIEPEEELEALIAREAVDEAVLAYSDLAHEDVMHLASRVLAAGASFRLVAGRQTELVAACPVVAVCAVRTGCGKSQTARRVVELLREAGRRVVVIRHPMPYGDLAAQAVQRFAGLADLERAACTIEEREEYEPHLARGSVVYAGVDYEQILRRAEAEADVIVWDGGNNDEPFLRPDLLLVVADPLRPGHEARYHPGEVNARRADVFVINKAEVAGAAAVTALRQSLARLRPGAPIVEAASPLTVEPPHALSGRRALVVEDGPTLTHGGMPTGAGYLAACRGGAEVVDPRPWACGSLAQVYARFPHLGPVLPAMGYSPEQLGDLRRTVAAAAVDVVVAGTPVDLARLLESDKPVVRVQAELQELGRPDLRELLTARLGLAAREGER